MKMIEIEASGRCNTHCLHCPREAISRPLGVMDREVFDALAAKLLASDAFDAVAFSGMGEPTLNPHLPHFVRTLSQRMPVSLTTNVSRLKREQIEALLDAGLDSVYASFSGHTPELYRQMMGGLDFYQASETVRELVRLAKGRARVSANVSVTPLTRPHVAAIRAHLESLGVEEPLFAMCHNRAGYLPDLCICNTPMPPAGEGRCDIFDNTLFVAWNGDVLACCHDLEGKGRLGNLVTDDLAEIMEKKRRIVQEGVRFEMCAECNDMYRFERDPTPDRRPLSEWVYMLAGEDKESAWAGGVQKQEAVISELEARLAAYERNLAVRLFRWLERVWERLRKHSRQQEAG